METITGTVQGKYPKKTKSGQTVWHVIINGTDINMAFEEPAFNVGDTATVEYEVTKWGPQIIRPGKPSAGGNKGGGWKSRPEDPKKQLSICRQNALGHATEIVLAITSSDSDPDPDSLADEIIRIAHKLTKFSTLEMDDSLIEKP